MGQFLGQQAVLFFLLDTGRDVAGHADHFHHSACIGFPDGPAGNLEPAAAAVAVLDFQGQGGVAVFLQAIAGVSQLFRHLVVAENLFKGFAPELFRPVAQQPPGGRCGVDKPAVRGVAGDQVCGVLGNQPVKPAGTQGFFLGEYIGGGVSPTNHDLLLVGVRNESPEADLVGKPGFHVLDGPVLVQGRGGKGRGVYRQEFPGFGQARGFHQLAGGGIAA